MKIIVTYNPPPIPDRRSDWSAYDGDTHSGEPNDPVGFGATPLEAIEDFLDLVSWLGDDPRFSAFNAQQRAYSI